MATSKKAQKSNAEGALSRIQRMAQTPRETPLERFVLDHFETIVSLKSQGYTVPDIVTVLKEEGFAASAPTVHAALNRAAARLNQQNPYRRPETNVSQDEAKSNQGNALPESSKKSKLAY